MPTWLPLMDMARRFGRAESTVRAWRDRHAAFVPERLDEQGRRTYPLEVMQAIRAMKDRRLRVDQIDAELERRQGAEARAAAPAALTPYETAVLEELRAIRAAVERVAHHLDRRGEG